MGALSKAERRAPQFHRAARSSGVGGRPGEGNSLQAVRLLLCSSSNSFTDILLFYNLIKFLEIIRRIDEQL